MTKYKNFQFYFGFAEDQSLACLLWTHEYGFDSVADAIIDLKNAVRVSLRNLTRIKPKNPCCSLQTGKYCEECGTLLLSPEFSDEVVSYTFRSQVEQVCQMDIYEMLEESGWNFFTDHSEFKAKDLWVTVWALDRVMEAPDADIAKEIEKWTQDESIVK